MLNGNKSYLISFTALFYKKGYELAFGVDTKFDTVRDTRYHLTAPAYSTYHTLKLDVMKDATKFPYTASSLLGDGLQDALMGTDMEGVEMNSAVARISSYLSSIHSYLSGETNLDGYRDDIFPGSAETVNQGDRHEIPNQGEIQGEITEAFPEGHSFAMNILNADAELGFLRGITVLNGSFLNDASESKNLSNEKWLDCLWTAPLGGSIEPTIYILEETPHALGDMMPSGYYHQPSLSGAVLHDVRETLELDPMVVSEKRKVFDMTMDGFFNAMNRSTEYEAITQGNSFANHHIAMKEAVVPESFRSGDGESGCLLHLEHLSASTTQPAEELFIDRIFEGISYHGESTLVSVNSQAEIVLRGEARTADPQEFADLYGEHRNAEQAETGSAEILKNRIAESAELSTIGRLYKIMLGYRAAETINAGLDLLIESMTDEASTADVGSITDTVISQLEKAQNEDYWAEGETLNTRYGQLDYSGQVTGAEPAYGYVEYFGNSVEEHPEQGESLTLEEMDEDLPSVGVPITLEDGLQHRMNEADKFTSRDGSVIHPSLAISDGNEFVDIENLRESTSAPVKEATLETPLPGSFEDFYEINLTNPSDAYSILIPESPITNGTEIAAWKQVYDAVEAPIEESVHLRDFDIVIQNSEHAEIIPSAEAYMQQEERARGGILIYDTFDDGLGQAALSNRMDSSSYEQIIEGKGGTMMQGMAHKDEQAESNVLRELLMPERAEWADNVTDADGKLDIEVVQGSGENVHDGILQDLIRLSGDNVFTGVVHEVQDGYLENRNLLIHDQDQIGALLEMESLELRNESDVEADLVQSADSVDVENLSNGTRKKKVLFTNIQYHEDALRKKQLIRTNIDRSENGLRNRKTIDVIGEESKQGIRRGKTIETVIEKSEGGTPLTPHEKKKPRIWLILGKVASWSIWNWKKTR